MDPRQIDDVTVSRLDLVAHLMAAGRWREARKAVSAARSEHHSAMTVIETPWPGFSA